MSNRKQELFSKFLYQALSFGFVGLSRILDSQSLTMLQSDFERRSTEVTEVLLTRPSGAFLSFSAASRDGQCTAGGLQEVSSVSHVFTFTSDGAKLSARKVIHIYCEFFGATVSCFRA